MATNWTVLTGTKSTAGSIKWLVNYEKVDPETALEEAEATIYGSLRVREMKAAETVAIAQGASTATLPTGFLDPILFTIPAESIELTLRSDADFERNRLYEDDGTVGEGVPSEYAIYNEVLNLDAASDAAYTGRLLFYKRPTALGSGNLSNFLCTRYPTILRKACQMHAADQMQDWEARDRYQVQLDGLIQRASVETDLALRGADYRVTVR